MSAVRRRRATGTASRTGPPLGANTAKAQSFDRGQHGAPAGCGSFAAATTSPDRISTNNGSTWTADRSPVTIAMPAASVEVGLAVTSHARAGAVDRRVQPTSPSTRPRPRRAAGDAATPDRHPRQQPGGARLDRLQRGHQLHREAVDHGGQQRLHRPPDPDRDQLHRHQRRSTALPTTTSSRPPTPPARPAPTRSAPPRRPRRLPAAPDRPHGHRREPQVRSPGRPLPAPPATTSSSTPDGSTTYTLGRDLAHAPASRTPAAPTARPTTTSSAR